MKAYETVKKVKEVLNLRRVPEPFTSEATAKEYASRKPGRKIVLGDDNKYWVTGIKDKIKLVEAGYEELPKEV